MKRQFPKAPLFWAPAVLVVLLDRVTKALAIRRLMPEHLPHSVFRDLVRFTLAYNPGAAFSMSLGDYSRVIFGAFAVAALGILWWMYRASPAGEKARTLALGLAWGGAAGNLIDRVMSARGVIDFIDIGVGHVRFWTFNVADSAVTIGAILLAIVLWKEENAAQETRRRASAATTGEGGGGGEVSARESVSP